MQGRVIDKLGRLIASTAVVSGLSALAESVDDSVTSFNQSDGLLPRGDDIEFVAGSVIRDSSNRLGQALLNRYESLIPVVEVLSGRTVHAIFSTPAEIAIIENEFSRASFGGSLY